MINIYALPERPETRVRKRRDAARALAIELRQSAIGNAYDYVLKNHPEVTEVEEQFDLAVELAIAALYTGAKDLTDEPISPGSLPTGRHAKSNGRVPNRIPAAFSFRLALVEPENVVAFKRADFSRRYELSMAHFNRMEWPGALPLPP